MTKPLQSTPLPAPENEIIQAWHDGEPRKLVAERLGIRDSELDRIWRWLKTVGKLPDVPRNPRTESKRGSAPNYDHDGRPSVNALGDDPLAMALSGGKR